MGFIKDDFYRGEYAQVIEKTYEDQKKIGAENYPYIVGSLSFLGRLQEAESFFASHRDLFTSTQRAYAYFFLALGLTRRSQYSKAKKFLLLNKALSKKLGPAEVEVRFLVEQGISFFLFFLGQFEKSRTWSERALTSALTNQDFWMRTLSYDLLANNLILTGQIHEGLRHFDEALKYAKKMKNLALQQAIETSTLIFRCEYGIDIEASFIELEDKISQLQKKDSFSKANLGLEYARQLTLRGEWTLALAQLDEISPLIYQSHNRRQEARLNLRWAEIYFLKNEATTCLHYVRSGKRCLEYIDQTYEIQFLGLELKVYEKLKKETPPPELKETLLFLSQKFDSIKNTHILKRTGLRQSDHRHGSEDQIHQLLLKAAESPGEAKKIILETHFFSWIYRFFNLKMGEKYILLNLEAKSITCVNDKGFFHKPNELSTLVYKVLSTLAKGFTTKEELVNAVWGYTYDPLRHDSLIYSSLSNLRKILGEEAAFIETSEMGYRLHATLINMLEQKQKNTDEPEKVQLSHASPMASVDLGVLAQLGLNSRQIQIMQYLEKNNFVAVKTVVTLFATSEITANRDLRALWEKKLVVRLGKGRATEYTKATGKTET